MADRNAQAPAPQSVEQGVAGADMLAVALLCGAGAIHLRAAIEHASHWWAYGIMFGVTAYGQAGLGLLWWRGRATRRVVLAALSSSAAVTSVWLLSRTVGFPLGPWAWDSEPIGAADLIATLDEILLIVVCLAVLAPASPLAERTKGWMTGDNAVRLTMMLVAATGLAVLLGSHTHSNP